MTRRAGEEEGGGGLHPEGGAGPPDATGPDASDYRASGVAGPSPDLQERLERAHRHGDEGDFAAMAEVLRETLEEYEGNPYVLCFLGVAERELGLDSVAYERFKECLAAQPEDAYVLATAGTALASVDDPDAEPALRAAAVLDPRLALARWMYGAYLSREGFTERALEELHAAYELDPDEPVIAFELGVAQALADDRDAAIESLYTAGRLDPEDGWSRIVLALLLVEDGRPEDAVTELAVGARLRPEDVEAQLLTALVATMTGHEDLAWEMLERGRMSAEGADAAVADAVDDRLTRGPEEAERLLRNHLLPGALRERLMARP